MAEQKFKVGDRIRITNFTGTIVGTKLDYLEYLIKILLYFNQTEILK